MTELSLVSLLITAATVGIVHTLAGPDHYVPFLAMAKAGKWSTARTLTITVLCGVGHVLGSIALGALGIALGWSLAPIEQFEGSRGSLAGWLLIAFGAVYTVWGLRRAHRSHRHTHWHEHDDGTVHAHDHNHALEHGHMHAHTTRQPSMTPWILFTIFVFGPCEPLIPLLMFPAASLNTFAVVAVAGVFAFCTIATMTTIVMLARAGLSWFRQPWLERHSHSLAGSAIVACGLAVQFGL